MSAFVLKELFMRVLWIVLILLAHRALSQCDETAPTIQNPVDSFPSLSEFLGGYEDGFHQFIGNANQSSGLILSYWHAEKVTFPDLPSYSSPSDGSSVGYALNGCQALDSDGTGVHCMYLGYFTKDCPVGYALDYSTGVCDLVDLRACLDAQPQICSDGLPPDLGGYPGCDRPELKQCEDGSYVRTDTGRCHTVCSDYLSCYNYVLNNSSCAGAQYMEFNYIDPENFEFTCSLVDESSPDHPDNGGNADGNPYNDPNTPTSGDGSTPNSGSIDPYSLAGLIGDELRSDLSNIERAVRDDIDQSKINTETLERAVNDTELAIRDSIQSSENNTNALTNSIESLGSKLDGISNSLNSGPCDPRQPDYYTCLDNPMKNMPAHTQSEVSTIAEANISFKQRIDNSELVQSLKGMADLFDLENAQCPEFSLDLRETPINDVASTTIHCDLMEEVRPIISAVMIVIYIWVGFRVFASA